MTVNLERVKQIRAAWDRVRGEAIQVFTRGGACLLRVELHRQPELKLLDFYTADAPPPPPVETVVFVFEMAPAVEGRKPYRITCEDIELERGFLGW